VTALFLELRKLFELDRRLMRGLLRDSWVWSGGKSSMSWKPFLFEGVLNDLPKASLWWCGGNEGTNSFRNGWQKLLAFPVVNNQSFLTVLWHDVHLFFMFLLNRYASLFWVFATSETACLVENSCRSSLELCTAGFLSLCVATSTNILDKSLNSGDWIISVDGGICWIAIFGVSEASLAGWIREIEKEKLWFGVEPQQTSAGRRKNQNISPSAVLQRESNSRKVLLILPSDIDSGSFWKREAEMRICLKFRHFHDSALKVSQMLILNSITEWISPS